MNRKHTIQIFSIIIILFGTIGVIFSFGALAFVKSEASVTGSVEAEFRAMSKSMNDASAAATNAAVSIRSAKSALESASEFTTQASPPLFTIAEVFDMDLPLIGRPFSSTSEQFSSIGTSLNTFSTKIKDTAENFEKNARDMERLSQDFKEMSEKLDEVSGKINTSSPAGILNFALLYFGFLNIIIILLGLSIYWVNK